MNNINQLLDKYIEYAVLHGEATLIGDSKSANINYKLLESTYKQIEKIENFEKYFEELLCNSNDSVLLWAAKDSLKYNEKKAKKILKKVEKKNKGILGFVASNILNEWKKNSSI